MPRKARVKSNNGIYHVMLRGANRQEIFHDEEDNVRFLDTIMKYKKKSGIKIYAWCLMSNHVHLLLREGSEGLSVTMKRIGVSFAQYYNWKYRTTCHLFQDRFKSENVETKRYLLTVVRYIHQNPVKAGIVKLVDEWKWSSCLGYYGRENDYGDLLDGDFILVMFSNDLNVAMNRFKEFNERKNNDQCLDDQVNRKRLTDEEAREKIRQVLGPFEIAQVKSLPRLPRNELLRSVKKIGGLSQRQAARILGVSLSLIHRA
ncbi:REP-associated tyrosine transposase [Virgibacillus sp. FSP13]